jgi:hypothetical protein
MSDSEEPNKIDETYPHIIISTDSERDLWNDKKHRNFK